MKPIDFMKHYEKLPEQKIKKALRGVKDDIQTAKDMKKDFKRFIRCEDLKDAKRQLSEKQKDKLNKIIKDYEHKIDIHGRFLEALYNDVFMIVSLKPGADKESKEKVCKEMRSFDPEFKEHNLTTNIFEKQTEEFEKSVNRILQTAGLKRIK